MINQEIDSQTFNHIYQNLVDTRSFLNLRQGQCWLTVSDGGWFNVIKLRVNLRLDQNSRYSNILEFHFGSSPNKQVSPIIKSCST